MGGRRAGGAAESGRDENAMRGRGKIEKERGNNRPMQMRKKAADEVDCNNTIQWETEGRDDWLPTNSLMHHLPSLWWVVSEWVVRVADAEAANVDVPACLPACQLPACQLPR